MFQHRFGIRTAVITAVALLIAQFGAIAHAYSHDSGVGPGIAHQSGPAHGSRPVSHEACLDCLNFAPLLSAAGAQAALPLDLPQCRGGGVQAEHPSLIGLAAHLAFRSRAPPALQVV
jgi:hypothetical protein